MSHDPDYRWWTYYKGKLLLKGGRPAAARELLLPVVRAKRTESWAWSVLAQTYATEEPEKAIACLCQAVEVEDKDLYLSNIRMELATLLAARGENEAARYEVDAVRRFKERAGQRMPSDLNELLSADWFDESSLPETNQRTYDKYSPVAESILVDGLPSRRALVVRQQEQSEHGPARTFVSIEVEDGHRVEAVVKRMVDMRTLPHGRAISVVADLAADPMTVLSWDLRENEDWDLIPVEIGVVEHVNAKKNVSRVVLGPRKDALLYHDLCFEASGWAPGSALAVRAVPSKPGRPLRAVSARTTEEIPPASIVREIEGRFEVPSRLLEEDPFGPWSYGFVNNVYVHRRLISKAEGLEDGDPVKIMAVSSGKGDNKWSAVRLSRTS